MSEISFLVDDNQWLDAVVKEPSGKRRTVQIGDCIEAQLYVEIPKTLAWGPFDANSDLTKQTIQLHEELYYFRGVIVKTRSEQITAGKLHRGKFLWESLVESEVPILATGAFPEREQPVNGSNRAVEAIGHVWGSISFHVGLSRPISGTITSIQELAAAPTSTGLVRLRILTLDTSKVGPLSLKLTVAPDLGSS